MPGCSRTCLTSRSATFATWTKPAGKRPPNRSASSAAALCPTCGKVLDDKSVQAVIVATPDHWHSPASILACEAGKHVYVEKPISHNIRESRLLVEASQRTKTLVQHGTQSRSTSTTIEGVKLLREGIIGTVLAAKCWNIQRRGSIGRGQDTDPPAGLGL